MRRPDEPTGMTGSLHGLIGVLFLLLFSSACNRIPEGKDAIDAVHLQGVPSRHEQEVKGGLSTKKSPRFLAVFPTGFVFEHETYDETALEKDLERVERQLRRRGYYEAKVTAARVVRLGEDEVRVEIEVDPGQRVYIRRVRTEGLAQLPFDAAEHALRSIELKANDPFDEDEYEQAKQSVANGLADVGYAFVRVSGKAEVDLAEHSAEVTLEVVPGPRATFGEVTIEGLRKVPEGPVRDALLLEEGELYSRRELDLARSALFRLGVFSKVEISPNLEDKEVTSVPITVRVEETALRSITAGGGATLDVLRLGAHAQVGWTHRNFLGGLRKFSISARPGVTFFPTRVDNLDQAPTHLLPENSLTVRLEQPSFFEGRTKGFLETNFNVYPLLYPLPVGADPREERIIGYYEIGASLGAERVFFDSRLSITLSANWRSNFPFTYQGDLVNGLEPVTVSYPELQTLYDFRDDPIQPTRGFLLSNSLQVAVPPGAVTDVRLRPEARAYVPLDFARKVVLATRFTMGFVLGPDYGMALENAGPNLDYADPDIIRDQHKLLFRAFYSGGPNSNRGYPYQRVGPQGAIGFLVPPGVNCSATPERSTCLRPLGGFSLWEASVEIRWNISGPWGLVGFVDASDVSSKKATFTFTEPHISAGPGIRYASPIGPIRLDVGYRIPGLQKLQPNPNEPPDVSEVPPYSTQEWWKAVALHVLIGEAF